MRIKQFESVLCLFSLVRKDRKRKDSALDHSQLQHRLLMRLHDCVGDEGCRDLLSAEPATVEALNRFFGGVDRVKFNIDFALFNVSAKGSHQELRAILLEFLSRP